MDKIWAEVTTAPVSIATVPTAPVGLYTAPGEVELSPKGKGTNTILQKAPDTKAQAEANGCQEQDKAEVELQEAPDTKAKAKVHGSQEQNKGEVELSPKGKETSIV